MPQSQETPNFTAPEYKIFSVTKQFDSIRKPVCKLEHTSGHDSFIVPDESIVQLVVQLVIVQYSYLPSTPGKSVLLA